MAVTALDHAETTDRAAAVPKDPDSSLVGRWGGGGHRAGRMTAGSAELALAEVPEGASEFTRFVTIGEAASLETGA